METIRNYLESMFAALPASEEVLRAKDELGAMMEDKYSELIAEGKSENEAVGIVISEFGNLEELSDELGLGGIMNAQPADNRNVLGISEAREFLRAKERTSIFTGLGVFLCIICSVGFIIGGFTGSRMWTAAGLAILFICIAAGVGLFIYSGTTLSKWKSLKKRNYRLDYATASAVRNDWDRARSGYSLLMIIGVICIILSVVPISMSGLLSIGNPLYGAFAVTALFFLIGIGVLLLVIAGERKDGYKRLLKLNNAGTVGSLYSGNDEVTYNNPFVAKLMSVYWPTVTAVYLILSFLTWSWGLTWIIWPIAGIASGIIDKLFKSETQEA